MTDTAMIQLRNVGKGFEQGGAQLPVLAGINLDVRQSEVLAIVGPSGCGKTTLLHCIAGFETIDTGSITIAGEAVRQPSPRRICVFQEPGIFPWLTVRENVGFGLPRSIPVAERDAIVSKWLELVGLSGSGSAYPGQLSGGMKQRVEFARALAVDPDVLYLDEPFGALDALTRRSLRQEFSRLWREMGKTCLMVTHDVDEACEVADRIAILSTRPATILDVVENPMPYPRHPDDPAFRELRARLLAGLGITS